MGIPFFKDMEWDEVQWRGCFVVLGAILIQIPLGLLYTISNMIPYVASYLGVSVGEVIRMTDLTWLFAALTIGDGSFVIVSGVLDKFIGPRLVTLLGTMIYCGGYFLTYFAIKSSFLWIILTYGLVVGIGLGLCAFVPISCAMQWFPDHTGLVNGIIASALGIGGIVFTPLETAFINPNNTVVSDKGIFTDPDVLSNIPVSFVMLGVVSTIIMFIGSILITYPDTEAIKSRGAVPLSKPHTVKTENKVQMTRFEPISLTPREILRTRDFYLMWFSFFSLILVLNMTAGLYKVYGQTFIKDDFFLAKVGSIALAFNTVGRFMWGILFDKISYKVSTIVMSIGQAGIIGTLGLTPHGGKIMYAIWIILIYIGEAGVFVLVPAVVLRLWGPKYYLYNFGLLATGISAGGVLTALVTGPLVEHIGFEGLFILVAVASVITAILTMFIREPVPSKNNIPTTISLQKLGIENSGYSASGF